VEVLQAELDVAKAQSAQEGEAMKAAQEELMARKTVLQEALGQLQADLQVCE
jgi:hypothetical protein